MNCKLKYVWTLVALIADLMNPVKVQFAVPICPPMFPPPAPPMFPVPAPMPIIAPALCPMPIPEGMLPSKTTTTTTTTRKPETIAIAVPVPMPMPVPVGVPVYAPPSFCQVPAPRPKNCPPCPPCVCNPSCTPAFFSYCSPCHMKCRCRNKEDTPEPLPSRPAQVPAYGMPVPMPIMGAPPVVIVPYPPPIPIPIRQPNQVRYEKPKRGRKYSSCSDDSTETSSSSESDYKRRRRYKKKKRYGFRRNLRSSDSENELVKPMLSYIAENGAVKFKTKIGEDDVAELLGDEPLDKKYQTVHIGTGEDENNRPKVVVLSGNSENRNARYRKVFLRGGTSNHVLENGKKELIFRPPGEKKISNLSVSFQII